MSFGRMNENTLKPLFNLLAANYSSYVVMTSHEYYYYSFPVTCVL